jgi:hypothetical protein
VAVRGDDDVERPDGLLAGHVGEEAWLLLHRPVAVAPSGDRARQSAKARPDLKDMRLGRDASSLESPAGGFMRAQEVLVQVGPYLKAFQSERAGWGRNRAHGR